MEVFGADSLRFKCFEYGFFMLYLLTFCAFLYVGLCDPGQVSHELADEIDAGIRPPPLRSHKSWQCPRHVMRYDHYCRWVTNCIGLYNHRTFLFMVVGMALVATLGLITDV